MNDMDLQKRQMLRVDMIRMAMSNFEGNAVQVKGSFEDEGQTVFLPNCIPRRCDIFLSLHGFDGTHSLLRGYLPTCLPIERVNYPATTHLLCHLFFTGYPYHS